MENTRTSNKQEKVVKPIEELLKEGWRDTFQHFSHFKIYKTGNERILYNTKNQTIEKKDLFDAKIN